MKAPLTLFFVLLTLCLAYNIYGLTLVSTHIASTVNVQPAIAVSVWVTDSDFNNITSFRAVFRPDRKTGMYVLASTNPGQFFLNILGINLKPELINITITYALDPAFKLKEIGNPVHVYADKERVTEITRSVLIADGAIEAHNVPTGGVVYVVIHLDYIWKGTKYTLDQVRSWYSEHTFAVTANSVLLSTKIIDDRLIGINSLIGSHMELYLVTVLILVLANALIFFKLVKRPPKSKHTLPSSRNR